jgi:hypothetical protein
MDLKTAYSFKRVWKEQVFDSDFLQRTETEGSLIVKKKHLQNSNSFMVLQKLK